MVFDYEVHLRFRKRRPCAILYNVNKLLTMKINRTIARAIAGQVIDNVTKLTTDGEEKLRKEIESSVEAKELKRLNKQVTTLENEIRKHEDKLKKRYPNIHINWSSDYLSVRFSSRSRLKAESIANEIILANQLQGIEIPKLLDHVSKKYVKQ